MTLPATAPDLRRLAEAATPGPLANGSCGIIGAWTIESVRSADDMVRIDAQSAAALVTLGKLLIGERLILDRLAFIETSGANAGKSATPSTKPADTERNGPTTRTSTERSTGSDSNGSGAAQSPPLNSATSTSDPADSVSTAENPSLPGLLPRTPEVSITWCLVLAAGNTASRTWSSAAGGATPSSPGADAALSPDHVLALLDRLAALEKLLALTPHGFTGGLEERIPWFIHCGISHGADRPDCIVCRLLSVEARALAGTPKP